MAEVIKMPKLSDTMTEGVVASWSKKVGDKVKNGEILAEIQTDKATMEFESYFDGVLLYIGVETGKAAPVDAILAIIGKAGEDFSSIITEKRFGTSDTAVSNNQNKEMESIKTIDLPKIPDTVQIVRMPKLSDTMTEGGVAKWHKKVGDKIKNGEILAEINTDKATMDFESFYDGVLMYIGVEEGQSAPVDVILAIIGNGTEDISAILNHETAVSSKVIEPIFAKVQEINISPNTKTSSSQEKRMANDRVKASPLAKKIAKEKGIDISSIHGSGDHGRIIKKDIETYNLATTQAKSVPINFNVGKESFTEEPVSMMRKVIAKRLAESKFSAPHFYLTMEIDMDNAIAARATINASIDSKISFNDMVIKAVAQSLRKNPKINSSWLVDKIRYNNHIHIGVAVAVPDGLLVPVVRFADSKSFTQISAEVKEFGKKAKENKLQPADWEGNTFTISNLGMFGIDEFTAIINPPDAAILAIGGIKQTPVVKNGLIVAGNVMKVTLSCDHRVVDGATGASFLQSFKQFLENPVMMLA